MLGVNHSQHTSSAWRSLCLLHGSLALLRGRWQPGRERKSHRRKEQQERAWEEQPEPPVHQRLLTVPTVPIPSLCSSERLALPSGPLCLPAFHRSSASSCYFRFTLTTGDAETNQETSQEPFRTKSGSRPSTSSHHHLKSKLKVLQPRSQRRPGVPQFPQVSWFIPDVCPSAATSTQWSLTVLR